MAPKLQIPHETGRLTVRLSDGASVSVRRWGSERERRVVISHGNGLAADGFWAFGRELLSDFEVVAFDLRSHGQSGHAPQVPQPWSRYIADIPEVFDAIATGFGARETHGAFHSMSSACTLIAQIQTPRPWSSLTLFEPPVAAANAPDMVAEFNVIQHALAARAAGRRRNFGTPEDLVRSFARAPSFGGITSETIGQLARATLIPDGDGWQLACPPEVEAANFDTAGVLTDHWDDLADIAIPVQLVLGDLAVHDMPHLARFGHIMAETFDFEAIVCPGTNHFMQLQQPEFCARQVAAFAKKAGKASADVKDAATNRETNHDSTRESTVKT